MVVTLQPERERDWTSRLEQSRVETSIRLVRDASTGSNMIQTVITQRRPFGVGLVKIQLNTTISLIFLWNFKIPGVIHITYNLCVYRVRHMSLLQTYE